MKKEDTNDGRGKKKMILRRRYQNRTKSGLGQEFDLNAKSVCIVADSIPCQWFTWTRLSITSQENKRKHTLTCIHFGYFARFTFTIDSLLNVSVSSILSSFRSMVHMELPFLFVRSYSAYHIHFSILCACVMDNVCILVCISWAHTFFVGWMQKQSDSLFSIRTSITSFFQWRSLSLDALHCTFHFLLHSVQFSPRTHTHGTQSNWIQFTQRNSYPNSNGISMRIMYRHRWISWAKLSRTVSLGVSA